MSYPAEERKVLTILFADVTGSTALAEQLDPEAMRGIMARFFEAMSRVIARHGGTVEKFIGDEVMAVFGLPAAHEDDPERAVRAALEMHAELARLNETIRRGPALQVRVGINTGQVIANPHAVEKGEFMVTGDAVNVAARMRSAAEPGTTVVGERTRRSTEWMAEYDDGGSLSLKGKAEPVRAWRLRGLRAEPVFRRGLRAPLVGRESELTVLRGLFQRVRRERRPHLVTILGLPGVGKSRLLEELAAVHPDVALRVGRSLPYGATSLWAVAEILRADCGILRSDPPGHAMDKLRARLAALFTPNSQPGEAAGVLAQVTRVLGLGTHESEVDAAEARTQLFWALRRYLEKLVSGGVLLLGFEDAHSADDELLDLIEHLAASAGGPIFIVCLARPDLLERRPGWGGGKRNYTSMFVEPLPESETEVLLAGLLAGAEAPAGVHAAVSVAGGNPLFIEEIVRMLIDRGALVRTNGGWSTAGTLETPVPDSVQGVITARLDQLPREEKAVALDASVLGKDFWMGALEAVAGQPGPTLDPLLAALAAKDIILERESSRLAGQREFTFKHMLIHDVAYSILPKSIRTEKHRTHGLWLERTLGDRAAEFADLLAHHWLQAARLAEEVGLTAEDSQRKAVQYALLAGQHAALVHAHAQAQTHFQTAQSLAERLGADAERAAAVEGQGDVLALQARWEDASRLYQEALDHHLRQGDIIGQAKVQSRMGSTFSGIFDFRQALPHIQSAIKKLEDRADEPELASVYVQMARAQAYLGALDDAQRFAQTGLAVAERLGLRAVAAEAAGIVGWARTLLGDPDTAAYDQRFLEVVEEMGDLRRSIGARMGRALRRRTRGDYPGSIDDVQRAMRYAQQSGNRPRQAYCLWTLGDLALIQGRWPDAAQKFREYLDAFSDIGSWIEHVRSGLSFVEGALDQAHAAAADAVTRAAGRREAVTHGLGIDWQARLALLLNRPADALRVASDGIAYYTPLQILWPTFLHPVAAEAALALGDIEQARTHLHRGEGYRWMELAPALARLARVRGLLAGADGHADDAVAALTESKAAFQELGQPFEEAQALGDLARALRLRGRAGDEPAAEGYEQEAAAIFLRLGVSTQYPHSP